MSQGSRVVMIEIPASQPARLERWLDFGRQLFGGTSAEPPAPAPRGPRDLAPRRLWQLAAANHRVLARGTRVHLDTADAEQAFVLVRSSIAQLRVHHVTRRAPAGYGWYLSLDGVAVLSCARWFDSERSRRESVQLAFTGLQQAQIDRIGGDESEGGAPIAGATALIATPSASDAAAAEPPSGLDLGHLRRLGRLRGGGELAVG